MIRRAPLIFGAFVVIIVGVIVAPMIIDFTSTDTDEHGKVPVPGERILDLPEGEVGAYYGERRKMPSRRINNRNEPLPLPVPQLEVRAVQAEGGDEAELRTSFIDGIQVGGVRRTTRQFGVLDVPAEGRYRVSVKSSERIKYPDPVLSLGTNSSDKTEWSASEWLLDNIQTVILIGVGLLIAAAFISTRLPGRRGGPPPPPAGGAGPTLRQRL